MSIFNNFIYTVETDFTDIENIFKKFFKNEPTWAQVALVDISYAAPILNTVITVIGGAQLAAEVSTIISVIQNDIVLATKFIKAEDSSKNLTDVLNNIVANLGNLLSLGSIKNHAEIATITAYVNGIVGEIEAILGNLPKVVSLPKLPAAV